MNKKTAFMIVAVLGMGSLLWAQDKKDYTVSFMIGDVAVKKANTSDWIPLKLNMVVSLGDSLQTKEESRIELETPARDRLSIGPSFKDELSIGLVSSLAPAKRPSAISVLTQPAQQQPLQTPTAIAAIRGKAAGDNTGSDSALDQATSNNALFSTPAETEKDAKALLDQAIALRNQVTELMKTDNQAAALAALEQSAQLTQRALTLLESRSDKTESAK